jgi:hypothetical protein
MKIQNPNLKMKNNNIKLKIFLTITLLFLGLFALPKISQAATYYVDQNHPQASDSNPGTEDLPWKTIQKAANTVLAGDTVIVKTGNYDERVILPSGKSGTESAKITFKAEPRRTVYMKGFRGDRNNYIRIEGFNITYDAGGWLGGGIWLDGNNWEIVDNYFYDVAGAAIQPTWQSGRSVNNVYLAKNKMYKCNKGFIVSGSNWLVEDNEVERLVYYNEDADYSRFFGENHIIRNNYFHGTRQEEIGTSHVDGFQTFDNNGSFARNIIIENNKVFGFFHEGIMIGNATEGAVENITVRNNIFANSASWGICAYGVSNLKVYNNIFAYIGSSAIGFRAYSGGPISTGEIKNNIFYFFGAPYWAEGGSIIDAQNNILFKGDSSVDPKKYPNDICNVDPKMVNPLGLDFRLQPGSPAIDGGVPLTGFDYDILGILRPQGAAWDIGAYEYVEAAPTDTTPPAAPRNLRVE